MYHYTVKNNNIIIVVLLFLFLLGKYMFSYNANTTTFPIFVFNPLFFVIFLENYNSQAKSIQIIIYCLR